MTTPTPPVALITGASSGIGEATAHAFLNAGFTVYATARRPETLSNLVRAGVRPLALDVTDEPSMQAAVQSVASECGAVEVLVNNAGYGLNGPVEEVAMDDIRCQFETNVFGLVRMCQLVLPGMRRAGRGRILNIGSIGGSFTMPGAGAYHASKHAVEAFNDALRYEVKPFGIDVVLIKPTGVKTPFLPKIGQTLPQTGPNSPYAYFKENYARTIEQMETQKRNVYGLVTAEAVAKVIVRAAQARHPRTRYVAGASGYAYLLLRRLLTDRAWDRMAGTQFPLLPSQSVAR